MVNGKRTRVSSRQLISSEQPAGRGAPVRKVRPTAAKDSRRSQVWFGLWGLLCALSLGLAASCSIGDPRPTGTPRVFPEVKFSGTGWREGTEKDNLPHGGDVGQILYRIKITQPNAGAILSIDFQYSSPTPRALRDEVLERYVKNDVKGRERPTAFDKPIEIGGRQAYGFSFYHDTHERWVQLWFVECGGGNEDQRCQIYLESPQGAPHLDPQLMKAFDHLTWTTYTVYKDCA